MHIVLIFLIFCRQCYYNMVAVKSVWQSQKASKGLLWKNVIPQVHNRGGSLKIMMQPNYDCFELQKLSNCAIVFPFLNALSDN